MARRLLAVVASAGLALAALTGCRLEAGNAAFVGDANVTQVRVDSVVNRLAQDGYKITDANRGDFRKAVVGDLLFTALAKRYAADKGYPAPAVDYQSAAQQSGLPANDPYLRMRVESQAYQQLLQQHSTPVAPTEADFQEMYHRLTAEGVTGSYEQIKPELQRINSIAPGLGLRRDLASAVHKYNVQVNPVFGAVEYPLVQVQDSSGQSFILVTLPLGDNASPAVVDAK
jgi:hypothetical protein